MNLLECRVTEMLESLQTRDYPGGHLLHGD